MPGPTGRRSPLSIYDEISRAPTTVAEALERRHLAEAARQSTRPRPWYDLNADRRRLQRPLLRNDTVWWDEETWGRPMTTSANLTSTTQTSAPTVTRHWSDNYQITAHALEEMRRQMAQSVSQNDDLPDIYQEFGRILQPAQERLAARTFEYTVHTNRSSMYKSSDLETPADYEAPEGSHTRAIVGIEVDGGQVQYAETSGRLPAAHVARVLMRYYNNRNRVLTHLFARPSKTFPSVLHPDPDRCLGAGRTTHLIKTDSYTGGTRGTADGSNGYGIAFLYTKDGWCVRSLAGWTVLTEETL